MTQFGQQVGVFSEAFHENVFGTVERGFGVANAVLCIEEFFRFGFRVQSRVSEQALRQRLQPGFNGNLAFGAALRLIRQIQIFESGFGIGGQNLAFEFV